MPSPPPSMSFLSHIVADPTPLKDAARGLRFAVNRGRGVMRDVLPLSLLPEPAGEVAGAVPRGMDRLATTAKRNASALARGPTGADPPPPIALDDLGDRSEAGRRFAVTVYAGLGQALRELGADASFVSEGAARDAFTTATAGSGTLTDAALAGRLAVALTETQAIRDVVLKPDAALNQADIAALAVFAVLLALLGDRALGDPLDSVGPCAQLALALNGEVLAARGNAGRLARLFEEFRHHV